jgi:predicted Zn-dependent protease
MVDRGFRPRSRDALVICLLVAPPWGPMIRAANQHLNFEPGFNLFAAKQDVEVGRDAAQEVNRQFHLLKDPEVVSYVNSLGMRLAKLAPNQSDIHYPWQFRVVDMKEINAFALPGGFIYVNRGAIEAAQNEAEIAGVIAHEEGHVVMRHGTHQASEVMLAQAPLAVLAGFLGQSSSLVSQLAQLGLGFTVNSILLKNSRSMEAQADQVGTYILYQAGYDPYAMARFFEIIQKKYPQRTIEFLSDHPNPGNRVQAVDAEIPKLGPAKQWKTDSPEFEAVKKRLESLPLPPRPRPDETPDK